jgi:hypothetical protein
MVGSSLAKKDFGSLNPRKALKFFEFLFQDLPVKKRFARRLRPGRRRDGNYNFDALIHTPTILPFGTGQSLSDPETN